MKKLIISSLLGVMCSATLASQWVYIGKVHDVDGGQAVRIDNISRRDEYVRFQLAVVLTSPMSTGSGPVDVFIVGIEAQCMSEIYRYAGKTYAYSKGKLLYEFTHPDVSFKPTTLPIDKLMIRTVCRKKQNPSSILVYESSSDLVNGIRSIMKKGNKFDATVQEKPF